MTERKVAKRSISEQELVRRMTPTDVKNAFDIIEYLVQNGEIGVSDAGSLMASVEPVEARLQRGSQVLREQQEERRAFLKRAGGIGAAVAATLAVGGGCYSAIDNIWGGAAQDKQRAIDKKLDKKLEDQDTLGTEQSLSSYVGWTVRYAQRSEGNFVPVGLLSDPIDPGTSIKLPSNKPNKLDDTGILTRDHTRSTDGHPVGKLSIVTKYIPATYNATSDIIVIGQEKVLRDQPTEDINTNIIVLENPATGQKSYLSIARFQAVDSRKPFFQLRAYQPQPKQ